MNRHATEMERQTGAGATAAAAVGALRVPRSRAALLLLPMCAWLAGCGLRPPAHSPEDKLRDDVQQSRARFAPSPAPIADHGSLWNDTAVVSLVGDTRAYRAGDLVTVNIVEATKGSQEAKTDLNKDANLSLATPSLAGWEKRLVAKHPNFDPTNILQTSTKKSFQGDGTTSRQTSIVASVTARVLGAYPNGDLAILGHKDVEVNHERQVLTLVGIVRAEDLGPDNTVTSERIAELGVHLGGRGDINDAQREGWLSRLVQKVWPF